MLARVGSGLQEDREALTKSPSGCVGFAHFWLLQLCRQQRPTLTDECLQGPVWTWYDCSLADGRSRAGVVDWSRVHSGEHPKASCHQRAQRLNICLSPQETPLASLHQLLLRKRPQLSKKRFQYLCRGKPVAPEHFDIFLAKHLTPVLYLRLVQACRAVNRCGAASHHLCTRGFTRQH